MGLVSTCKRTSDQNVGSEGYVDYRVFDPEYREIGRVMEVLKSADGNLDYVGVRSGFLGMRSVLIPVGLVAVDDGKGALFLR